MLGLRQDSKNFSFVTCLIVMGPDPTWAYFWPTVNKRPTRLWTGCFLTWPEGEKIEKFHVFKGKFYKPKLKPWIADLTRPETQKIDLIWIKNFWPITIASSSLSSHPISEWSQTQWTQHHSPFFFHLSISKPEAQGISKSTSTFKNLIFS